MTINTKGDVMSARHYKLAGVAAVLLAVLIGAGWFGWQQYTEHQQTQRTQQVTGWVEDSLREEFRDDPALARHGVWLVKVSLIRVSDVKYEGMVTVRTAASSTTHDVAIDVTADDEKVIWHTDQGAWLWLAQEQPEEFPATP